MTIVLNSSQAQQNFGATMDRATLGDDVVIERYGTPRVAMMAGYRASSERAAIAARLKNDDNHVPTPSWARLKAQLRCLDKDAPTMTLLLNFSHPLTPAQLAQIEALTGQSLVRLAEIMSGFEEPSLRSDRLGMNHWALYNQRDC